MEYKELINIDVVAEDEELIPQYESPGATCVDLKSAKTTIIPSRKRKTISTGIKIALPKGYEGIIRPRSSMGQKNIIIPNSPATIDEDYRGTIKVMLYNNTDDLYIVNYKDRIAQFTVKPIYLVAFNKVGKLDQTQRGESGFGSTGR